jgi:hypothetical protein
MDPSQCFMTYILMENVLYINKIDDWGLVCDWDVDSATLHLDLAMRGLIATFFQISHSFKI